MDLAYSWRVAYILDPTIIDSGTHLMDSRWTSGFKR